MSFQNVGSWSLLSLRRKFVVSEKRLKVGKWAKGNNFEVDYPLTNQRQFIQEFPRFIDTAAFENEHNPEGTILAIARIFISSLPPVASVEIVSSAGPQRLPVPAGCLPNPAHIGIMRTVTWSVI